MTIYRPGQRIHFVPGIGINVITPQSTAAAAWWLSGGISAADVAGVWQAKGAASLAASYLRLAGDQGYANIDPAIVGGVAPTWNMADGWIFNGSQWLNTGIIPVNNQTWSAFILYSDAVQSGRFAFGCINGTATFGVQPISGTNVAYLSGNYRLSAPNLPTGNLAVVGNRGYRNGIIDSTVIPAAGTSFIEIYVGGYNSAGTPKPMSIKIKKFVVYKITVTAPQALAVAMAMSG